MAAELKAAARRCLPIAASPRHEGPCTFDKSSPMTNVTKANIVEQLNDLPEQARVLTDLMAQRFTCRAYSPEPVDRDTIDNILRMAQLTASWCNTQPWQVIVTEGSATREFSDQLYALALSKRNVAMISDFPFPASYEGVYAERRRECAWQLYDSVGVTRGDRVASAIQSAQNFRLFDAPHVAIITTDQNQGVYGAVDTGGYVTSFMLAAQSLGIATTPQAAIAKYSHFVRDHFQIPPDRCILCAISFGYADETHSANRFRTKRASLDQVVSFRTERDDTDNFSGVRGDGRYVLSEPES